MEVEQKVEKVKKEYEGMVKELESIQIEYDALNQEYKERNRKLYTLNDKIDDLEVEIDNIKNYMNHEEKHYIEKKQIKVVKKTIILTFATSIVLSLLFGKFEISNTLVPAIITTAFVSPIASFAILNSKIDDKFRNKYRETEDYIKSKELVEHKEREKEQLKSKTVSLGNSTEQRSQLYVLERQIEQKKKEIEIFKNSVFDLFFGNSKTENEINDNNKIVANCDEIEEKISQLVKVRKNND